MDDKQKEWELVSRRYHDVDCETDVQVEEEVRKRGRGRGVVLQTIKTIGRREGGSVKMK